MIKIDEEYRINADNKCYSLEKVGKIEDENSENYGQEKITTIGYYTTLQGTINGYMKEQTRKYISEPTAKTIENLEEYIINLNEFIKSRFKDI